jgi:hypothetical protein
MTSHGHGAEHDGARGEGKVEVFDHEIDLKGIVNVGVWLAVVTVAAFGASWFFYRGLASYERKALDRAPSPMREANLPRPPAGPLLQASPEGELAAFRRAEQAKLTSWGWVDQPHAVAHVPVERAIDAVAANGLPNFSAPAAPPAEGTP